MSSLTRKIWVTFQKPGFHRYPAAPDDVSYLQSTHRHLFKFKVTISVEHADREIEFHMFLNWLESLYKDTLHIDYKSCEMLAHDLLNIIDTTYPGRFIEVEVAEDGECGAIVSKG